MTNFELSFQGPTSKTHLDTSTTLWSHQCHGTDRKVAAPNQPLNPAGEHSNVSLLLIRFFRHLRAARAPGLFLPHFQRGILPSSFIDQLKLQGCEDTVGISV